MKVGVLVALASRAPRRPTGKRTARTASVIVEIEARLVTGSRAFTVVALAFPAPVGNTFVRAASVVPVPVAL